MSSALPIDLARSRRGEPREHATAQLLVEVVALRCQRRLAWLEQLTDDGGGLGFDSVEREASFYAAQAKLGPINARIDEIDASLDGEGGPLRELVDLFRLSPAERDLLVACVAIELEPALGELYARLSGHRERRFVTAPLVARMFGHGRHLPLAADGALMIWGLVHRTELGPGQASALTVDAQVLARLRGRLGLDAELVGFAELIDPHEPLASWPLASLRDRIERSLAAAVPLRVVLIGPQGSGRRSLAANLARSFEIGALAIDTEDIDDESWAEVYVRVLRLGVMAGLLPVWHGRHIGRRWPRTVHPGPLQFVICEDARVLRALPQAVDQLVVMPNSDVEERLASWRKLVPISASWPAGSVERLASRHRLAIGDVAEIGRRMPTTLDEAGTMAREQTRGRLGELGRLLDCPFEWSDLVLSEELLDTLQAFSFEGAERARFWDAPAARRLFPRGTGLVGLLAGPPGTGKTMAAQVIAADLELDLFRVNLATVISKYIGETAKNLDKIFSRASRMNAVLLFDEADALFSKRTDVKDSHDRYANTDTNYLLQLLEDYQGIALLATNKKNNIDPAFIRRIRYVVEFRRPDAVQRRTIWRRILGEMLGADTLRELEPAVAVISEGVEMSGAQIKNAMLASVFIARRRRRALGIEELLRGIDRELAKEGRVLNDRERDRLRRHVRDPHPQPSELSQA